MCCTFCCSLCPFHAISLMEARQTRLIYRAASLPHQTQNSRLTAFSAPIVSPLALAPCLAVFLRQRTLLPRSRDLPSLTIAA